jgi:hypothetical protein
VITLKNGLIISANNDGFQSFNHLTSKIDKGSFVEFKAMPDIFYKELDDDDRITLTNLSTTIEDKHLTVILERTKMKKY